MFEQTFKSQLALLTDDKNIIDNFWEEIKKQYSKPGRYYHNLSHLDNLLEELDPIKSEITDWQTLIFSIAYHDIIYNPLKKDNEERSAKFAYNKLSELRSPVIQREKCFSQIIATKGHSMSEDTDINFFIDADLAILGSGGEQYKLYSAAIRKEYKIYPDIVYKPGRRKVLQHFIQMPNIYKTEYFRNKYEEQARKNLNAELKLLSS
jgi:predicted metal-dependent HD superfamily phosphohydrolase